METPDPSLTPASSARSARVRPDGWITWLGTALRHEPGHALTLAYLAISLLGLWASYWFFGAFGVPVLDYMDPTDYLTAGLRDPIYLLLVLAAVLLVWLITWPDRAWERDPEVYLALRERRPWLRMLLRRNPDAFSSWMQRHLHWRGLSPFGALALGVGYATLVFVQAYVRDKAEGIRHGGGHAVRVTLAHTHEQLPGSARLLGTIGDFVLLYWPEQKRAEAIAVEEVGRIESVTLPGASPPAAPAAAPAATTHPQ